MDLGSLVDRPPMRPWEYDRIPWADGQFSARMLREHLDPTHDGASRRAPVIEAQCLALAAELPAPPADVLDLCCGPGLHAAWFGRRGHRCTGIDISPASIAHARSLAATGGLPCSFVEGDVRSVPYPEGVDLAKLLYGEFNTFSPADAHDVLSRAWRAVGPGGTLVLELRTPEGLRAVGDAPSTWTTPGRGVFAAGRHLVLRESAWHEAEEVATVRWHVIEEAAGRWVRYGESHQAYPPARLRALLTAAGIRDWQESPSAAGAGYACIVARRPRG